MNKFATIFYLMSIFLFSQEDSISLKGLKYNYFKHNILLFNEYLSIDGKGFNTTDFRYKTPLLKGNWVFRFDVPIVSDEFTGKNGLGDMYTSVSYMPYRDNKKGYWIRGRLFIPTASSDGLGYGKWIFSSTFAYGRTLSKKISYLVNYEHRFSFAGDLSRRDYHRGVLDQSLNFSKDTYWVSLNPTVYYDFNSRDFKSLLALEIGKSISKASSLYIRPSLGLGEVKYYDSGFEFGITTTW